MGPIFTKGDLKEVSEEVAKYKVRLIASIFSFRAFFVFVFLIISISTLYIVCFLSIKKKKKKLFPFLLDCENR